MPLNMAEIRRAQKIAEKAHESLAAFIASGKTEAELRAFAQRELLRLGATGWWLHNSCGLVLVGENTIFSGPSGTPRREDVVVGQNDIVSADLIPAFGTGWGDMSRTYFVQDGKVTDVAEIRNAEYREGMALHRALHEMLLAFVEPETTYEDLYYKTWEMLDAAGYVNLDYHDNFGHSVEIDPKDRVTIAKGVTQKIIGYGHPITYEPHISRRAGKAGFKHEDMYVIQDGKLRLI